MKLRPLAALVFVCVALLVPASTSARAAEPNITASRYVVTIDVRPDGSLDVVERITLRVGGTPATWFERRVPGRYTDGLTDVAAFIDGRRVETLTDGLGVRLRQRSGALGGMDIDARWQFAPTTNGERTIELRYRALHVLAREAAGPHLVWHALPTSHTYPIDDAEVTVRAPDGALAVALEVHGGQMQPATSWADGLVVTQRALRSNDGITVDVTFSADTIRPVEPNWVAVVERQQKLMPAFLTAGITLLVIGAGTLIMIRIRTSRGGHPGAESASPAGDLSTAPAMATSLVSGGQTSSWLSLQAAFFRLVRDGAIAVRKTSEASGVRAPVFTVTLQSPDAVSSHERWIIEAVREAGPIALGPLATRLMRSQRAFDAALRADMSAQGWLDADRVTTARGLRTAGIVLMLIALASLAGMAISLVPQWGPGLMAIPAAVFVDGVGFVLGSQLLSRLSDAGEHEAARWRARVAELRVVVKAGAGQSIGEFDRWLPLAIGAGLGTKWVKTFAGPLRDQGRELGWMAAMGAPEDVQGALHAVILTAGATHSGGAASSSAGAGAGGGSSSAG